MKLLLSGSLAAFVLILLSGCSPTPGWLRGSFEVDIDATMKAADQDAGKAPDNSLLGVVQGLARAIGPAALAAKYGGASVVFTGSDMMVMQGGSGDSVKIEIVDRTDPDVLVIKTSGGKLSTWKRTETGIARKEDSFWLHYKRVK